MVFAPSFQAIATFKTNRWRASQQVQHLAAHWLGIWRDLAAPWPGIGGDLAAHWPEIVDDLAAPWPGIRTLCFIGAPGGR